MSKYEDRAYRTPKPRTDEATAANQLRRLKNDLEQYAARNPHGPMIGPLRERIRELETIVAAAQAENERRKALSQSRAEERQDARGTDGKDMERQNHSVTATSGRFPPRYRPGQ